ncbi:MAG: sulfatase [Myxococcota bacterium]
MLRSMWLALILATSLVPACRDAGGRPPNLVVFLVDDMGWMDSGVYGSRYYETPNIDALAARGMRFSDAYSAHPLCSPTRASIISGQHPARLRFTHASGHVPPWPPGGMPPYREPGDPGNRTIHPRSRRHLSPEVVTYAEVLKEAGYVTAHLGKWHLGVDPAHWPDRQGFDVTFHGAPDNGPPSYFSPYRFRAGNVLDGPRGEYITDRLTDEAVAFIEAHRDRPFLLNLWHYGVHGPWGHKPEITRRFAEKTDPRGLQSNPIMASMLWSIDESLGRVVEALDRTGQTGHTIIVFASDNGGNVVSRTARDVAKREIGRDHPAYRYVADYRKWAGRTAPTNNAPLRGGKGDLYEGGVRVPLIVVWPGVVRAGALSDRPVSSVDFYPTFLEMAGVDPPSGWTLDGRSLMPILDETGADAFAGRPIFDYFPHAGRLGRPPSVAVRRGRWKWIQRYEVRPGYPDAEELYDLESDPGETQNRAAEHPEVREELAALVQDFLSDTDALVPKPNPDYVADRSPQSAGAPRPN